MMQRRRSANARLARKTLVGVFILRDPKMAVMIRRLPATPRTNVRLKLSRRERDAQVCQVRPDRCEL